MADLSGVWFHGSPYELSEYRSAYETTGGAVDQNGVYFSRCPWVSFSYARQAHRETSGGWVYAVELDVHVPEHADFSRGYFGFRIPKVLSDRLKAQGRDCFLMPGIVPPPHTGQHADEIALFGPRANSQVRTLGRVAADRMQALYREARYRNYWTDSTVAQDSRQAAETAFAFLNVEVQAA
ncbi:hypothetical protein [Qipengyuania spongiae]|uniref:Uncharacterized protein n=1 Tax=Qipengyuania spongiae TaxID=2909673 RepID=A0ABY5SXR8_9SPHN|nr:hypothetical protein [Qipengyuania spongiae]UVI39343.1 hypothetical protein L1F33_14120 [Qipengyuania spongiae]